MIALVGLSPSAFALTLAEAERSSLSPGVELVTYRTSSPATDAYVVEVDLCAEGVRVDTSRAPTATESVAAWAADLGPVAAINGDFFRTSPTRVYGDAVGGGVPWPSIQTGRDPSYAGEWFYGDFGWVAFLHDEVTFTHTGWSKDNAATLGISAGHAPTTRNPEPPDQVMALVSGFPALVIEGAPMTCADPVASSCFPDRSDMRDRHPRTALGLSSDLHTLFLVTVDGRSSTSSGMYGSELADLMGQLGAWQAFNLDGGGSSTLWTAASGVVNRPSDGSARAVANHLGVFAGPPTGGSVRPWHCDTRAPCAEIPPGGATLDEAGDCFYPFGPPVYLREVAGEGEGGSLVWTNQFSGSQPWNQAWWRFHFEEGGDYLLEWHGVADYAVADAVPHRVRANGMDHEALVDQSVGDGWHPLGTFTFAAGGDQGLAIEDQASGSVASNQHIVFDAVRLTRVGAYCGDSSCDGGESCASCPVDCPPEDEVVGNGIDDDCDGSVDESGDTGTGSLDSGTHSEANDSAGGTAGADTEETPDDSAPAGEQGASKGGCAAVESAGLWALGLALLGVARRRAGRTA